MEILTRSTDGLKRNYNVFIPSQEVDDAVTVGIADAAKRMRMDGFRPGKVPMDVVRRMHGDSIREDTVKKLISDTAKKVLKDENVKISFNFSTEIVKNDEHGIEFALRFEIIPDIELKDFSSIELTKHVAQVSDHETQEVLEGIRRECKRWVEESAEVKIKTGHKVTVDLEAKTKIKNRDYASVKDFEIIIGDTNVIDDFWKPLIGECKSAEKEITVHYPKNMKDKAFAGKTIEYMVSIKKVERATEYDFDDEFAKSLGYENFEQLRNWAQSRAVARYEQMSKDVLKRDLLEKISYMFDFEVPQNMLAVERQDVIRQISEEAKKLNKEMTDKIKDECNKIAERRVRLGFVIAEIAKREKISVSKNEISDAIKNIAAMYPGYERAVWDMYTKGESMNAIIGPILESKVVEFLYGVVKIKEEKCSVKKLIELDEEEFEFFQDDQNHALKDKKTEKIARSKTKSIDAEENKTATKRKSSVGVKKEKKQTEE